MLISALFSMASCRTRQFCLIIFYFWIISFFLFWFNVNGILLCQRRYSWPLRAVITLPLFSNTYSASGRLSEGESMESLTSLHSAQAHNHTSSPNSHHRSSLTHNKLIMHRDAQGSRLNRSNSIRWVPHFYKVEKWINLHSGVSSKYDYNVQKTICI